MVFIDILKGGLYRVIGVGKHSETLEEYVLYTHLDGEDKVGLWVRPRVLFEENVLVNGHTVRRFMWLKK